MQNRTEYMRDYMRRKRENVNKPAANTVDVNTSTECPEGHDPKMWEYACERAARAKRYASRMPEHIRPSEVRFQSPEWQYADQSRYPLPAVSD